MPKTNAEYCRYYRKRKRENNIKMTVKSSTECVGKSLARRNALMNVDNDSSNTHIDDLTVQSSVSDHRNSAVYPVKMTEGTCLLCFSITRVLDIKYTHLHNLYEELSDNEMQAESHPLCYICYTKLHQCKQLWIQMQKLNSENQTEVQPLVQLQIFELDNWSLPSDFVQIQLHPIKTEYIKEENVESRYHNENELAPQSDEDENPTEQRTQTDGKPYSCDVCSKKFTHMGTFETHKLIHTDDKFSCDECGKKFIHLSALKLHKRTHTGEKPYTCDVCNKTFTQLGNLKMHYRIHTGDKPYACDVCNKKFSHLSGFKTHKLLHTGEKLHECDLCNKKYTNFSTLKKHKLIHTDKPHTCDVCSKTFTQLVNLKSHLLRHRGVKPYSCDVCDKNFAQAHNLKAHKLIHNGEKPYSCEVCSKKFTQIGHLKTHKITHTGDKPYSCSVCDKLFISRSNLERHKRVHI